MAVIGLLFLTTNALSQGTATPVRSGASLPATCGGGNATTPSDTFVLITGGVGRHYTCTATNVWTPTGSSSSPTITTVTPEQFGAKGDGVTDDTTAIQAAITACSGSGLGYVTTETSTRPSVSCTVVLGTKTYLISSALTIQASFVGITGQGQKGGSVIMSNSTTADIIDVTGTGTTGTTAAAYNVLQNFTVMRKVAPSPNCNGIGTTPAGIAFSFAFLNYIYRVESFDSCNGFKISGTNVHLNFDYDLATAGNQTGTNTGNAAGFYIAGSTNSSRITNCVVTANGYGFFFNGAADVFMDRDETNTALSGFYFQGQTADVISYAAAVTGGGSSLEFQNGTITGQAGRLQFYGGYYHGGGKVILINNSNQIDLIGGEGASSGGNNFVVVTGTSHDVLVSGMIIAVSSGAGTSFPLAVDGTSGASRISFINNNITAPSSNHGATAIAFVNGATLNTVSGNTISGFFDTAGISFDGTSNNNSVTGNTIDTTNISTPISNLGTGNVFANKQGGSSFPTYATTTNCAAVGTAANPSVAACAAAAAGSFSCATNASTGTCTVNTTAVTAKSQIYITQRTDTTTGTTLSVTCNTGVSTVIPVVTAVTAATSFTINLGTFNTNPECFSYSITN